MAGRWDERRFPSPTHNAVSRCFHCYTNSDKSNPQSGIHEIPNTSSAAALTPTPRQAVSHSVTSRHDDGSVPPPSAPPSALASALSSFCQQSNIVALSALSSSLLWVVVAVVVVVVVVRGVVEVRLWSVVVVSLWLVRCVWCGVVWCGVVWCGVA